MSTREIPTEKLAVYGVSPLLVIILCPLLSRIPRNRVKHPIFHLLYLAAAIASLFLSPHSSKTRYSHQVA
jgi:hypothetical protein